MPIFRFACPACKTEIRQLIKTDVIERILCSCGGFMERQLPSSVTKEMKDPHRGVSNEKGLKEQLTKRMRDHHDRHETAEKIDRHGMDDAVKLGWDKKAKR